MKRPLRLTILNPLVGAESFLPCKSKYRALESLVEALGAKIAVALPVNSALVIAAEFATSHFVLSSGS